MSDDVASEDILPIPAWLMIAMGLDADLNARVHAAARSEITRRRGEGVQVHFHAPGDFTSAEFADAVVKAVERMASRGKLATVLHGT